MAHRLSSAAFRGAAAGFRASANGQTARFASTHAGAQQAPFLASRTAAWGATAATAASLGWLAYESGAPLPSFLVSSASANMADEGIHAPHYPWSHNGMFDTFDHASIRRGYQVYREVCSACHSVERIHWRNLVGVSHTVDEVKAMAEEVEYEDGPDDNGEMFQRPGKLADPLPKPYPNEQAARAGNAGGLPPDLSLITKARHGGADYVFALITGYCDPPAGFDVPDGLNHNPYFPGGKIAMARVLYDGLVDYEESGYPDVPATTSQMAKDVVTFLAWASEPEHDERKKMGAGALTLLTALTAISVWTKRMKWANVKNRKLIYETPKSH